MKALHVVAAVAWMAALMYLPRLFVCHHQSEPGGEAERAVMAMERRLANVIMTPAMLATWAIALVMVGVNRALFATGWFHIALTLALALTLIHGYFAVSQRRFHRGERPRTQKFWRVMNELPFLIMAAIVILAIAKPF